MAIRQRTHRHITFLTEQGMPSEARVLVEGLNPGKADPRFTRGAGKGMSIRKTTETRKAAESGDSSGLDINPSHAVCGCGKSQGPELLCAGPHGPCQDGPVVLIRCFSSTVKEKMKRISFLLERHTQHRRVSKPPLATVRIVGGAGGRCVSGDVRRNTSRMALLWATANPRWAASRNLG